MEKNRFMPVFSIIKNGSNQMSMDQNTTIAVIGLGYVGLPLAVEFGKNFRTIGFDLKKEIIENYKNYIDPKKTAFLSLKNFQVINVDKILVGYSHEEFREYVHNFKMH